jgi:ribosomal protein S18 acetylase RimI-like enzyme
VTELRRLTAADWREWREIRLAALREAPYAYGSTVAEWEGEGDTELRWRYRLTEVPFNVMALRDGVPAGIVSGTHPDESGTVELISMWVAPFARGKGVGDELIRAVIAWAEEQDAARVMLAVVSGNTYAAQLYRRHRFVDDSLHDGEQILILPLKS